MDNKKDSKKVLWKYAGMGAQFLVGIALGIFIGIQLDKWLHISFPLLVWLLPLLIIVGTLFKIINDTNRK